MMKELATPALYHRIDVWVSSWSSCCNDDLASCPDCGSDLCVFCQDACEGCGTSVF